MRQLFDLSSPLARTTLVLTCSNVFTTFARSAYPVDFLFGHGRG